MSSKIRINKICQYCEKEFEARKTTSKTCSDHCAKMLYKTKKRTEKIEIANAETLAIKAKPIEELKVKEFLTVKDVATLLNCSLRSVYYYIESGNIKAVNLGQRITRVKRSEIDKLFA
jgi:excisionase family DNA binding protein